MIYDLFKMQKYENNLFNNAESKILVISIYSSLYFISILPYPICQS